MKPFLRFFISATVGVTAFGSIALADMHEGSMHKLSGHVRTRLEYNDNTTTNKTRAVEQWVNRARFNLDVMPSDSLKVRISPEVTHTWSSFYTNNSTAGVTSNSRPAVTANEAWMAWMPSDMIALYVGRQELSLGSELFLGNNDWEQTGQRFDAVRAQGNYDFGTTTFLFSKMVERDTAATGGPDGNLFLLYNQFNVEDMNQFMNALDVYGFYWHDTGGSSLTVAAGGADAATKTKLFGFGARFAGDQGAVDYSAEVVAQFGKVENASSQKGYTGRLNAGYSFMEKHRVGVVFDWANSEYNNLFGETHPFLGQADIISRRNVISFGGEGDFNLTDMIYAGLDVYYFMKANKDVQHTTATGTASAGTKKALGMEADLRLGYNPEENLNFELGYAFFSPSGALDVASVGETAHDLYVQGTMSF